MIVGNLVFCWLGFFGWLVFFNPEVKSHPHVSRSDTHFSHELRAFSRQNGLLHGF